MADMLVRLFELPDSTDLYKKVASQGIRIFRPMTPNKAVVFEWIKQYFGQGWANENDVSFSRVPVSSFIAYDDDKKKIVGFAAYDCTAPDFFGPTGVDPEYRGKGIGAALCMKCMEALRDEGYGYAIIGSAGPKDFYRKVCGAELIENSTPGIYKQLI